MEIKPVLLLLALLSTITSLEPQCSNTQLKRFIDISTARLEPSKTYQYHLVLHDTPIKIIKNESMTYLKGDFATLLLRNTVLKKEYEYKGKELFIKIPADHVFSPSKHANLEIQILFDRQEHSK